MFCLLPPHLPIPAWSALTGKQRAGCLRKLSECILAHREHLTELEVYSMGKPKSTLDFEFVWVVEYLDTLAVSIIHRIFYCYYSTSNSVHIGSSRGRLWRCLVQPTWIYELNLQATLWCRCWYYPYVLSLIGLSGSTII